MHLRDVVRLMRPRQWTKNLAVFAALVFSGELFQFDLLATVALAFVAFSCVSSGLYSINDALDAERDRAHPDKKSRPVASGAISPQQAFALSGVLIVAGLGLAVWLSPPFAAAVAAYLAIQTLYIFWLKNVAIVDMLVIATGFVMRAVAGALVIGVDVSPWLVLCTGLLALFLAAAKRRHELLLLRGASSAHRPVLGEYSAELLDSFMVTLSAATITAYALYTFFEARSPGYLMMVTIPFVIYGVLRYEYLVLRKESGGKPEEVLLGDRPIMIDIVVWVGCSILVLYAAPALLK